MKKSFSATIRDKVEFGLAYIILGIFKLALLVGIIFFMMSAVEVLK